MAEADPQAAVLTQLAGIFMPSMTVEHMQTALTIFIALLLEVGSAFGMYIAFSQWRLYDRAAPAAPAMATMAMATAVEPVAEPKSFPLVKKRTSANDNKTAAKLVAPENDVERFYKERLDKKEGSSVTSTELYEDYCNWCEEREKEPLALPTFCRDFGELGVVKAKIAGRVRHIGIALKIPVDSEEDKKLPALETRAA